MFKRKGVQGGKKLEREEGEDSLREERGCFKTKEKFTIGFKKKGEISSRIGTKGYSSFH